MGHAFVLKMLLDGLLPSDGKEWIDEASRLKEGDL